MVQVRMKFSFNGTRWIGGPPWPAFNEILETSEEDAAKLVAAGHAVYVEDEPEAKGGGFESLNFLLDENGGRTPSEETHSLVDDDDPYEEEDEEPTGPRRPYTNEKKELWVDYAVALGEDREVADRMSKADLISKYGASL